MPERRAAHLVLEDGEVFEGEAAGFLPPDGVSTGELVFNTSMSGYQEVLTDPSYSGQVVCFTYPHIGSYGVTPDDDEAAASGPAGSSCAIFRRGRRTGERRGSLEAMLESRGVPGITGIDTRTGGAPGAVQGCGRMCVRDREPAGARRGSSSRAGHDRTWISSPERRVSQLQSHMSSDRARSEWSHTTSE